MDYASLVAGLFGGAGATLLWELVLRPILGRRALAEVLAAEVSLNLQLLGAAWTMANPRKIPPDFSLSTRVFEAIVDRVGELPPQVVAEVVFLYRYFAELNEHPRAYAECVKELRGYEVGSDNYRACEREVLGHIAVFNQYVEKALTRIGLVQPLLLRQAFPWWSLRRRQRPVERELKLEDLQGQIAKATKEREAMSAQMGSTSEGSGVARDSTRER